MNGTYILWAVIQDDGPYDLDAADGLIVDPPTLSTAPSGSDGGETTAAAFCASGGPAAPSVWTGSSCWPAAAGWPGGEPDEPGGSAGFLVVLRDGLPYRAGRPS